MSVVHPDVWTLQERQSNAHNIFDEIFYRLFSLYLQAEIEPFCLPEGLRLNECWRQQETSRYIIWLCKQRLTSQPAC